jgi:hypothetical protein
LEYKFILKDTYKGLSETIDKSKKFNSNNASEEELEDKVKFIMESIYQDLKEKDSKIVVEEFRKKLISEGKVWSGIEVVLGGGGASLLAKLATLPIAIGVTVGQAVSTPTYRKTFQVVAKLIQIKKRVEIEEKIKEI